MLTGGRPPMPCGVLPILHPGSTVLHQLEGVTVSSSSGAHLISSSPAIHTVQAALEMRPNDDEARAAHYNAACCYVKLQKWDEAVDNIITATNQYDLKFMVAIKASHVLSFCAKPGCT